MSQELGQWQSVNYSAKFLILALPLISCVTLGKFLNLLVSFRKKCCNNRNCLGGLFCRLNETVYVKCLEQYLRHGRAVLMSTVSSYYYCNCNFPRRSQA